MSTYSTNMEVLQKVNPQLAERIRLLKDDLTVKIIPNESAPSVSVKDPSGKVWLIHDKKRPTQEAANFVNIEVGSGVEKAHIILVFGLGLGYEFEALFNKYMGPITQFIVIENNIQLFKKFISTKVVTFSDSSSRVQGNILDCPSVHFLVDVPLNQIYNIMFDLLHHSSGSCFTTFNIVEHPVLIRFNKEYYKPIITEVARACYDIKSSFGNDPEDSWLGMDHMLQNTDMIARNPGIIPLKDQFKDVPAMIVATGPSLNKNIHLINAMAEHCVFFAADASVNTFVKQDVPIIPDLVCSLERSPTTKKHFTQVPEDKWELLKNTFLCACPVVRPGVYKAWKGKYLNMYRDFAHFRWLHTDRGTLHTGKSVTNLAWKVAEYMGCNPIIMVGQDLAFARDGQTHVKGADHASNGLKNSPLIQAKLKCMGYDGKEIETLDTWVGMRKRFEYDIAKNPNIICINATEGGALIAGTYPMKLQECLDLLSEKVDFKKKLDLLLPLPSEEQIEKDTITIAKHVDNGYQYLYRAIIVIDKILDNISKFLGKLTRDKVSDGEFKMWTMHIDKMKNELLGDEYSWFTMMHVIQSWLMGRDNVLRTVPSLYSGEEERACRALRLYELFRGLKILYKLVFNGTKEMYYDRGKEMPDLLSSTEFNQLEPGKQIEK